MTPEGYGAIGAYPFGSHPDELLESELSLAEKLVRGAEVETLIMIQVYNRTVSAGGPPTEESEAIGALPFGAAPDELAGAGAEDVLLLSDGDWCGRPDDFGAAHREANPLIFEVGDFQEEVPYLPEQDRRQTSSVAVIRAANGEGDLDDFLATRTIEGQRIEGFLVEEGGYSRDWIRFFSSIGASADPELDECRFELQTVASLLEVPALRETYLGTGGAQGGPDLAGKYVPLAFGDCWNVEPDLESRADLIDRWTSGNFLDVAVYDGRKPLLWDGVDHATYSALKNASVAPGFFTKASAIGRTKRGAEAQLRITGDLSAPNGTTASALLALARGAAGLSEDLLNAQSFGALPADPIDLFLKGDSAVNVDEIFDALLRPFNGWYGQNGESRLAVGVLGAPEGAAPVWVADGEDILADSFSVRRFDEPPRWRVAVTGARNWTPMTPEQIVDYTDPESGLSEADWRRAQGTEATAEVKDSGVRQRYRGAIDAVALYGPIRGYFSEEAGALAAAQRLFSLFSRGLRKVTFGQGLDLIFARPASEGRLTIDGRLGMSDGLAAMAITRRFAGSERAVYLTALAPVT